MSKPKSMTQDKYELFKAAKVSEVIQHISDDLNELGVIINIQKDTTFSNIDRYQLLLVDQQINHTMHDLNIIKVLLTT